MCSASEFREHRAAIMGWMGWDIQAHRTKLDAKLPPASLQQTMARKMKKVSFIEQGTSTKPSLEGAPVHAMKDWVGRDVVDEIELTRGRPEAFCVAAKAAAFVEWILALPEFEVVIYAPTQFLVAMFNAALYTKDDTLLAPYGTGEERVVMLNYCTKVRTGSEKGGLPGVPLLIASDYNIGKGDDPEGEGKPRATFFKAHLHNPVVRVANGNPPK